MIKSFRDTTTQDVYDGLNSKAARKFPKNLHNVAFKKLDMLNSVKELTELRVPPGNRLEALSGDLMGCHSIRINDQWRIVFKWTEGGPEEVYIEDYHY